MACAAWFLLGGADTVADWFGTGFDEAQTLRRVLLVALSVIYLLRFIGTNFLMLQRKMEWSEIVTVGIWVAVIHWTMAGVEEASGEQGHALHRRPVQVLDAHQLLR